MFRVNELVFAVVIESVTLRVRGKAPASIGVPEIVPVLEFRVKPSGKEPDVIEKVELYPPVVTAAREKALSVLPVKPDVGVVKVNAARGTAAVAELAVPEPAEFTALIFTL